MAELGKCLLFYLKYPAEMARLYETNPPLADGLPNSKEALPKIRLVGDGAYREAEDLLLKGCAPRIESHFRQIGSVGQPRFKPATWEIYFWVGPKGSSRNIQLGICLSEVSPPGLLPWIWCRGGRNAESKMREALNSVVEQIDIRTGAELRWSSGCLVLGRVEIKVPDDPNEAVAREPLVEKVQNTFALLTEEHVKKLAAISGTKQ